MRAYEKNAILIIYFIEMFKEKILVIFSATYPSLFNL